MRYYHVVATLPTFQYCLWWKCNTDLGFRYLLSNDTVYYTKGTIQKSLVEMWL